MVRLRPALIWSAFFGAMCLVGSVQTAVAAPFVLQTAAGANLGCVVGTTCPGNDETIEVIDKGLRLHHFDQRDEQRARRSRRSELYLLLKPEHRWEAQCCSLGDFDLASESTRLAAAIAVATDELTISSAELNGQAGTLDVSFLLTGTLIIAPARER